MLLRKLGSLALASAAALLPYVLAKDDTSSATQATFVSPDEEVAFAVTVGDDENDNIYFILRAKSDLSWAAVGLGSDDMPGALYFVIYKNEQMDNVTFSPRLAYGHYEPKWRHDTEYHILDGTGIQDGYMTVKASCSNCRSWPAAGSSKGRFDTSKSSENAIFAYGAKETYHSDDKDAPLKYHTNYGTFDINMKKTKGSSVDDLKLTASSTADNGDDISFHRAKGNWKTPLHGSVMVVCSIVLLPAGLVLLRTGGLVKWHALVQIVATAGVLLASALGIVNSFLYQRSRKFDSLHQVLGFVTAGLLLTQIGLGFRHHIQYRKTKAVSGFAKIHVWLGRIILFFGAFNCFLGFTFAVNRKYGMILAALILFVTFGGLILIAGQAYLTKKKRQLDSANQGVNRPSEPWRQPPPQDTDYPSDPPPGYEPPSHQIGLGPMSPVTPWQQRDRKDDDLDLDLGTQQRPREFT